GLRVLGPQASAVLFRFGGALSNNCKGLTLSRVLTGPCGFRGDRAAMSHDFGLAWKVANARRCHRDRRREKPAGVARAGGFFPIRMCRVMGLPGKPNGMSGGDVEHYYREGRIREIAACCETDVVNTYRVWLRYELFRGRLGDAEFRG